MDTDAVKVKLTQHISSPSHLTCIIHKWLKTIALLKKQNIWI